MNGDIRNILLAFDFSDCSFNALEAAVALARKHKAVLHLLHVHDDFPFRDAKASFSQSLSASLFSSLVGAVMHVSELELGVVRLRGTPYEEISNWTCQHPSDLLVMGLYGKSSREGNSIGTTAYNVLKYSNCPVLLVPATPAFNGFKKALIPVKPITGALSHAAVVRAVMDDGTAVEVLPYPYSSAQEQKTIFKFLATETAEKFEGLQVTWPDQCNLEESLATATLKAASTSETDLLVLTPSLGQTICTGHMDRDMQKLVSNFHGALLYLMNCPLYKHEPVPSLLHSLSPF